MRNNKNSITCNIRNITSNLQNITSHFTGKAKNITLAFIIIILSSINITLYSSGVFYNTNVFALDYSGNVGIGFTFNPTLSVSISPSDLIIDNLIPGSTLDSNSINVSVATNAAYGYTLSATAGDSLHNDTNLTHTNNTDIFSSIAIDADLTSLDTDNTWGYTSKLSNETTWGNYNGLSSSNNTVLLDNSNAADSTGSVDFKISAKASSTQPSGEYTGTINFVVVSKVAPMSLLDSFIASGAEQLNGYFKMQDMTHDICSNVDIEESELQLIDVRDNKIYWVAKLKDGNCWMTQNLDLDGGTEITSEFSDIPENYTLPTANSFLEGNKLPTSSQIGFSDNTKAYVYNSGNHTNDCSSPGCYSYYSWVAVTAGSGANITTNNNAPYSICPKNWKLPDILGLIPQYSSGYSSNFYNNAGPNTIPNFLISKCYANSSFCSSNYGNYWHSTSESSTKAIHTYFSSSIINSVGAERKYGLAARCLAK